MSFEFNSLVRRLLALGELGRRILGVGQEKEHADPGEPLQRAKTSQDELFAQQSLDLPRPQCKLRGELQWIFTGQGSVELSHLGQGPYPLSLNSHGLRINSVIYERAIDHLLQLPMIY
jgi:hypothetical protein